ncbi:hypothetical protein ACLB2K_068255 [Fragaria x ananassa]
MAGSSRTTSSGGSNAMSEIDVSLKRNSEDVGWEYGALVNLSNLDKVKCKLCGKIYAILKLLCGDYDVNSRVDGALN